jgi:hypothetical protein
MAKEDPRRNGFYRAARTAEPHAVSLQRMCGWDRVKGVKARAASSKSARYYGEPGRAGRQGTREAATSGYAN